MSSLYTHLVSAVLFPFHERLKGHDTVRVRRRMEETQWWPWERLEALQLERLQHLLRAAYQHVPYYRRVLEEQGVAPEGLGSLDDLARLPLLSKGLICAHRDDLKANNARGLARFNTGGSTGEPLIFYIGKERVSHDVAAKWRATRWWGVDIGDPEVVVWGSPIELGAQGRFRNLRDRLLRTRLLPAFEMSKHKLDEFVRAIRAMRPKMLFGYPSALAHIATHAELRGQRMDNLGVEVAFVTAERLYEHQEAAIRRVFGCRVANGYGGRDAGFIAHACPEGGMHMTAEDMIVEIVDSEGKRLSPGQTGEVVVTHLATRDFPFIRYRTGDVAVLDDRPCSCGRGLPLLKDIQGRTTDFLVAQDGTVMHGLALIYVIRAVSGIEHFKIIQESLDQTRIQLVTNPQFHNEDLEVIRRGVKERLGGGVAVELERVAEISAEASGKFRYVISHIGQEAN